MADGETLDLCRPGAGGDGSGTVRYKTGGVERHLTASVTATVLSGRCEKCSVNSVCVPFGKDGGTITWLVQSHVAAPRYARRRGLCPPSESFFSKVPVPVKD